MQERENGWGGGDSQLAFLMPVYVAGRLLLDGRLELVLPECNNHESVVCLCNKREKCEKDEHHDRF